jgi:AraC-like DNA-binding protein/mannose-6-phosphate isomerase-like protein (cupin superfamily)
MQKALIEVIESGITNSFLIREFKPRVFESPFHFHPEFELALVISGNGSRLVGNHIEDFTAGDLVLVGCNVPHCWKTDTSSKVLIECHSIVVHFTEDCFGEDFFKKAELQHIAKLLRKSYAGIQFSSKMHTSVIEKIKTLVSLTDSFKKMMLLLEILDSLTKSRNFRILNESINLISYSPGDMDRLNKVYDYLAANFKKKIKLDDVTSLVHMTPNAFCKYFKKVSRRTLIETVQKYRVNYAVSLLVNTNLPITDICYESGFGNLSHFNKSFKDEMKLSPLQYRKKSME